MVKHLLDPSNFLGSNGPHTEQITIPKMGIKLETIAGREHRFSRPSGPNHTLNSIVHELLNQRVEFH